MRKLKLLRNYEACPSLLTERERESWEINSGLFDSKILVSFLVSFSRPCLVGQGDKMSLQPSNPGGIMEAQTDGRA